MYICMYRCVCDKRIGCKTGKKIKSLEVVKKKTVIEHTRHESRKEVKGHARL